GGWGGWGGGVSRQRFEAERRFTECCFSVLGGWGLQSGPHNNSISLPTSSPWHALTLLTRVPSAARPLRGGPGPPSLFIVVISRCSGSQACVGAWGHVRESVCVCVCRIWAGAGWGGQGLRGRGILCSYYLPRFSGWGPGIFPTQGSNPGLLYCRQSLYRLSHKGSPLESLGEGGVVALFKVCRQDTFRCLYPQALRTLASICCVEEGVHQLEKVDGVLCLADILTDDSHSEATRAEAAAVVAQVTSPHLPFTQHLSSFLESMEEIVTALVKLCQEASSGEVFLLASAALANITFFDTMACEMLLQLNAIRVLLEACNDKQRVDTPYTRDQIVTILANMSVLEQCASDIIQENGVQLIMGMLSEKPRSGTPAEVAACERVQQKAAVTLARLSRDPDVAREAVRLSCMSRLIELCRSPSERNSSDAVLVACLAALRRLAGVCPEGLQDSDFQQLVQPRLVDSFLLCSNMEESFV
ncbi:hypothetical protein FD755_017641, partial [Muntiacus reevesi]